ncbi:Gcd10p family-domain-containing protein [Pyronema omphalodes]|nr:Gcd10p family-domain-containing protein [Pyronema omphalodes]
MAPPSGDRILPYTHVLLRLPSGVLKIIRILPDTSIYLGKFGTFPSNALLHRPYNLTFDILDNNEGLRVVPAQELTRDILGGGFGEAEQGNADETHYDLSYNTTEGEAPKEGVMRTNRNTVDNAASQTLTWEQIEELKKTAGNSGKDIIQKLVSSHVAIDQKTAFSLQKYTLRKASKFMKRFSVHRLTVSTLTDYLHDSKEPFKFLEIRNHHLGLMMSLGNIVYGGRYLVIDETGGLLVAALAERLGVLNSSTPGPITTPTEDDESIDALEAPENSDTKKRKPDPSPATRNTITLIHANEQPNLSLLTHFNYDANTPPISHPLYTHLKTLTWLQLLAPDEDTTMLPPDHQTPEQLAVLKPGKRSAYYRKLRRWQKVSANVTDARNGGYDAVLVAAHMSVPGILKAVVPLVKGSGQVVVYTPSLEQATELADLYSSARKTAWIQKKEKIDPVGNNLQNTEDNTKDENNENDEKEGKETQPPIPVETLWQNETPDPTLLLAPTVHRSTIRAYQVLPGRTHPVMTSKGGAEGYVFHATRVLPVEGKVDAKGAFASQKKKRRTEVAVENTVVDGGVGGGVGGV